jgi:hypothetical protein
MKLVRGFSIFVIIAMLVAVVPAYAQLGETDISSFTVQNIDTTDATVTVRFIQEDGTEITPTVLNASKPNPFTLTPGSSFEIYLPGIPDAQLPNGRYSVVIESNAQVVAIANLIGQGARYFNGSYSGFSDGATEFYLPGVVHNYYGWYSLISVQNVGSGPADVTVTITCANGTTGTLTQNDVPQNASKHFDLETMVPTGFTAATSCNGSAAITSDQPVVVVDNQSVPANGNTQSYGGVATGYPRLFAPALYTNYYGWNASLNIRKLDAGATTVTVTYSDGGTSSCSLTDAVPSCLLYMPSVHPTAGYYGATIAASPANNLVAIVNAANGSQAQTYNAIGSGTGTVGIPSVMKSYYGWNTSFTCQNVGTVATTMNISYAGYAGNAYDTALIQPGGSIEKFTPAEAFLPNGHVGGATVTANASGALVSCIVNFNNPAQMSETIGDWSMSYNAFNR